MRSATIERTTQETAVRVQVWLDDPGRPVLRTGVPMLDHFVAQLAFHANMRLEVEASSNDGIRHHLVEDVAIACGRAVADATGDRSSIERFATITLPMDDALVRVAVDLVDRPYARVDLALAGRDVEGLEASLVAHFFSSFATSGRFCLHVDVLAGCDPHHCCEACFKALGRALRCAAAQTASRSIASTKGVL